jgi:hypothetical protein
LKNANSTKWRNNQPRSGRLLFAWARSRERNALTSVFNKKIKLLAFRLSIFPERFSSRTPAGAALTLSTEFNFSSGVSVM